MTVVAFAEKMMEEYDTPEYWLAVILKLKKGNPKWGPAHKFQVNCLISWLISGSRNINELKTHFRNQNLVSIPT